MIKGILIDLNTDYGVILTEEGQFLRIKRFGPLVEGQPVFLNEEDIIMESKPEIGQNSSLADSTEPRKPKPARKLNTAFLGIIAASMLLIAISTTWFAYTANSIYTAVIVDINPSIELDLNKNNKVVKLIALNTDALELDLAALKGKQIDDALELLIADAGSKGFFTGTEGDFILITTVAMRDQSVEALKAKLVQKFEDSETLQRTNMALANITPAQLNLAKQNQVPAGLVAVSPSASGTSVVEFFKVEDNVKAFEDSGVIVRGSSVDTVTGPTVTTESSTQPTAGTSGSSSSSGSSDDTVSELTHDLQERLTKLKTVINPSATIKAFIVKAEAYFNTGNGDLRALTAEAKTLWDAVKKDDSITTQSTSASSTSTTSSTTQTTSGSSSDSTAHLRADLAERLQKLKGVSNPSDAIKAFIVKADAYFASGTGNLAELTREGKALWEVVKDTDDDDDDDDDSTQGTTSSTSGSSDDTTAHLRADLAERLQKLKGVSNPSDVIKAFIVRADAYFANGTGNLAELTREGKALWDAVKDADDDDDDDDD